ncbi:unnamed protein product [Amoebophrya sp. A25]|nr:unnamed protein product [Amoebophrya sp. A25]|eukprot:GSA25T00006875001.1
MRDLYNFENEGEAIQKHCSLDVENIQARRRMNNTVPRRGATVKRTRRACSRTSTTSTQEPAKLVASFLRTTTTDAEHLMKSMILRARRNR